MWLILYRLWNHVNVTLWKDDQDTDINKLNLVRKQKYVMILGELLSYDDY
jgi:hypothetical protein